MSNHLQAHRSQFLGCPQSRVLCDGLIQPMPARTLPTNNGQHPQICAHQHIVLMASLSTNIPFFTPIIVITPCIIYIIIFITLLTIAVF
jgi:hypothetical protein